MQENYPDKDAETSDEQKLGIELEISDKYSLNHISEKANLSFDRSLLTIAYFNSEREAIKNTLQEQYNCLQAWSAHYDYDLWDKVEEHFNSLWLKLYNQMLLGIEYGLYEEIRNLFSELRNFLQSTSKIKERIYFAAWLKRESERRQDPGTRYLGISSLVWSYTSSGCYQNLKKAYALWKKLDFYMLSKDVPIGFDVSGNNIKDSLGCSLYTELFMEVQESGVRLATRHQEFEQALVRLEKGKHKIEELFNQELISLRLKERFMLAFNYHEGINLYLKQEYDQAEKIFDSIFNRANHIGWKRVAKGAQSWLATLAMASDQYDKCSDILEKLIVKENLNRPDKRDGICQLIKAELSSKKGQKKQAQELQENAVKIFKECSKDDLSCNFISFKLLSSGKL
jgi:hypothetical protein